MKVSRNYKFVLTVLDNSQIESGEVAISPTELSGEKMFSSECHYYTEKNIIEAIKEADKRNALSEYYGYTYCIYKENKPKKITETETIDGEAMLVEVITIDENGVTIR